MNRKNTADEAVSKGKESYKNISDYAIKNMDRAKHVYIELLRLSIWAPISVIGNKMRILDPTNVITDDGMKKNVNDQ